MLVGHKNQWKFLEKSWKEGRLSHAYLFSGQEKVGKKTVVLRWVSLIFGEDCSAHPDLITVEPLKKEIQISQIKELIRRVSLKAYSAPYKVAVIDQAHLMNEESQSALLKTLEEPKGNTIIVLISEMPEMLLPTIISRVDVVKFYPVERREIEKHLEEKGAKENDIKNFSRVCLGSPGRAMDFLSSPDEFRKREAIINDLKDVLRSDLAKRFDFAKELSQDNSLARESLNVWLMHFREMMLSSFEQKGDYGLERIKKTIKAVQETIQLLSNTNVNTKLALENLMLEI